MVVRIAGVVGVLLACVGCEVAEAPPLREDARDTSRETEVSSAETEVSSSEDTSAEPETEDTITETETETEPEPEDTSPETEDTSPETADTSPEPETADTSAEPETDDTSDAAACQVTTTITAPVSSPHVTTCSEVVYATDPPTSGPHYPIWAKWQTYAAPVPRGFYVHNLEHGGVVIAYRCPDGCDAELAALATMVASLPADPLCALGVERRVIVTPDPLLATRFAVVAWGASLVADCVDVPAFAAFIDARYATGPENTCADGVDVTVPDLGTYCPPD